MDQDLKHNLARKSIWIRGLYLLLFAIFCTLAEIILFAVVVVQFLHKLFTRNTNERLLKFGQSLAIYIYQIVQFLNFNSDFRVYPYGPWPRGTLSGTKKPPTNDIKPRN